MQSMVYVYVCKTASTQCSAIILLAVMVVVPLQVALVSSHCAVQTSLHVILNLSACISIYYIHHCSSLTPPPSQENSTTCPVTTSAPPSGVSNSADIAIGIIFGLVLLLAVAIAVTMLVVLLVMRNRRGGGKDSL